MATQGLRTTARSVTLIAFAAIMQPTAIGSTNTSFKLVDSRAWVMSGGNRVIYWMDDERLIFIGRDLTTQELEGDKTPALLKWEVGKQIVTLRRDVDTLCYRPGQIRYSVRDRQAKARLFYQGELGKEAQVVPKRGDQLNCVWISEPQPEAKNRAIRDLLPGHGYLDLGPARGKESTENSSVVHVAADGKKTRLPFGRWEPTLIQYHAFRQAYFVRLHYFDPTSKAVTSNWPRGVSQKAYWLWPDGKLEKVELPNDLGDLQPSRVGFAYRITATDESKNGVYLLTTNAERVRITPGHVIEMAVSPDGCKLAFSHAADAKADLQQSKTPRGRTLKVADLCLGRPK